MTTRDSYGFVTPNTVYIHKDETITHPITGEEVTVSRGSIRWVLGLADEKTALKYANYLKTFHGFLEISI